MKMKRLTAFLAFVMIAMLSLTVCAQMQRGYVKTRGRLAPDGSVIHGERLGGVIITIEGRNAVLSDSLGNFTFPVGDDGSFRIRHVSKKGYVSLASDIVAHTMKYSSSPIVIVMESEEVNSAERIRTMRRLNHTLRTQIADKEQQLEHLKAQDSINLEEFNRRMTELYDRYGRTQQMVGQMADRYVSADYDCIDEFHRRVNQHILEGELDRADSLLNSRGSAVARAEELSRLSQALDAENDELNRRSENLRQGEEMISRELEQIQTDLQNKETIRRRQQ